MNRNPQSKHTYTFLLDTPIDEPEGRMPPHGRDEAAGSFYHVWSTSCARLSTAIRRVIRRCETIRTRTGLDWLVDQEVEVDGGVHLYIGDDKMLAAEQMLH